MFDSRRIFLFVALLTVAGVVGASAARAEDASELWSKNCAVCHGKDGKGKPAMKTQDFTDPAVHGKLDKASVVKTIKEGFKDESGKEKMKAFGSKLDEAQINALADWVMALK